MLTNLVLGLAIMVLCLVLQIGLLVSTVRYYVKYRSRLDESTLWSRLQVLSIVLLLLVIGNLGQISIWAVVFQMLGEFDNFELAFYHSAVNFGALGYGDIVMSDKHKLLGALEAINGVLMIGISTAVMMGPFKDVLALKFKSTQNS